jgi:hypothetical protein
MAKIFFTPSNLPVFEVLVASLSGEMRGSVKYFTLAPPCLLYTDLVDTSIK